MKQKIIFYVMIFSILINLFLVTDYGKRLNYTEAKLQAEIAKTEQLHDSIIVLQKKLTLALPTKE